MGISRLEPDRFHLETTTVWSFPERGDWATHRGSYRGNWAPEVPRNLILRYTQPGETVLDPMMGSGTSLLECLLTNRQGIGIDIEPDAVELAASNLNLGHEPIDWAEDRAPVRLFVGDARSLDAVPDESVQLAALHPPYSAIIAYGPATNAFNLSHLSLPKYIAAMRDVAVETYRVLAPDRHCAVLIGDTRRHKHYVPLSVRVLEQFLDAGFVLREDIIKLQHKMKSTREKWRGSTYDFYLIAHEHLYVFRKPAEGENLKDYRYSVKWR
ncbi:MAG TPA: DNA methyltransferase [Thermoplasmata archaeon]|nr:DNA methyltransferase [Thermoplasmata archaeon]